MTDKKDIKSYLMYKSELVKAMDVPSGMAFYGVLKDVDATDFTLVPYMAYKLNTNGQFYSKWVTEGKPLKLSRQRISALHPADMDEIENLINNDKRTSDTNEMKVRLEEITTEMQLLDMEEAYNKRKRKE